MNHVVWYQNPTFWVLAAVLLPFLLFVTWYGLRSKGWWRQPPARAVMILANSIVFVLGRAVLNFWLPADYAGREALGFILLGMVGIAGWYLFVTLLREQRIGRAADRLELERMPLADRRTGEDRRRPQG